MWSSFLRSAVLPRLRLRPLQLRDCLAPFWLAGCCGRFLNEQCSNACQSLSMDYWCSGKPVFTSTVRGHAWFGTSQTFEKAIAKRARMHLSCLYHLYHAMDSMCVQVIAKPTGFAREQWVQVSQQKVWNAVLLLHLRIDFNRRPDVL